MRLHAIAIIVVLLLAACSQEKNTATDSSSVTAITTKQCAIDTDCADDLICVESACKKDNGTEVMCPTYSSSNRVAGCFSFCQSNETLTNDPFTPKCFENVSRMLAFSLVNQKEAEENHEVNDVRFTTSIQVSMSRADRANNMLRRSVIGIDYLFRSQQNENDLWREGSLCMAASTVDRGNETLADNDHEIAIEIVPIDGLCCKNQVSPEDGFCKPRLRIVPEKM